MVSLRSLGCIVLIKNPHNSAIMQGYHCSAISSFITQLTSRHDLISVDGLTIKSHTVVSSVPLFTVFFSYFKYDICVT